MKAVYDEIARHWIQARQALPPLDSELISGFGSMLPPSARVLDLGCGTGCPIGEILSRQGSFIHGIDRSKALLREARRRLPNASFELAEIEDHPLTGPWDGVVFFDALFHIPRSWHRPLLARIFAQLSPGGRLVVTSGGSREDVGPFTDRMFGVEFFYDAFPRDEFVDLCRQIGYAVERQVLLNEPDGMRDRGRLGLLLRR